MVQVPGVAPSRAVHHPLPVKCLQSIISAIYVQKENQDFGVPLSLLPPASIWQLVFAFLPASGVSQL